MQREILFKAKRKDNGEWVEGMYTKLLNDRNGQTIHAIVEDKLISSDCYSFEGYEEIDPATLCQYTNLKDADGNKIFHNDILQAPDRTMVVVFCDETFTYYFKDLDYINKGTCLEYSYVFKEKTVEHFGLKIIGNVHDEKQ